MRWEEGRAQGQLLTPEELCRDCPELLAEVRQGLRQLDCVADLIEKPGEALTPPPPVTTLTAPQDGSLPPAAVGSRYRKLRFHAGGGLGEVYVGLDQELRREVALKRIRKPLATHPEAHCRFLREAEVTVRLEHPGIVPVYGLVADDDGTPPRSWAELRTLCPKLSRCPAAPTNAGRTLNGPPPRPAPRSCVHEPARRRRGLSRRRLFDRARTVA
jgi:hypothetical protein